MIKCKKTDIEKIIESLPEITSVEEVMEKLYLFSKIEKGIHEADSGFKMTHSEVKEKMKKWLEFNI
jgi:predicted transcriptional regulator